WQAAVFRIECRKERTHDRGEPMTMMVALDDEAARIVEQQVAKGRYPDAESAVTAALLLLDDAALGWGDVDVEAVKSIIAEADPALQFGELPPEFRLTRDHLLGRIPVRPLLLVVHGRDA